VGVESGFDLALDTIEDGEQGNCFRHEGVALRLAIVSDIHGNRTAFEAILADLSRTSPDLVFHGGDLADGGASPTEIVDRIRDLGWPGVSGNGEEMLCRPESLQEFAKESPRLQPLFAVIEEMAAATRAALGEERLAWLRNLPLIEKHASPKDRWRAPRPEASDAELESVYGPLGTPIVVYGHIHRSYIRSLPGRVIANTGSVSLSYDGDTRASYLLLDDSKPSVRRVDYDINREVQALSACGFPHADWVAKTLASGRPQMPAWMDLGRGARREPRG
jgi:predicted phosphodiesterase